MSFKIEDEVDLKNAVSEAEAELAQLYNPYHEAEDKLRQAQQNLADWFAIYG
jgi:hypothetical protein